MSIVLVKLKWNAFSSLMERERNFGAYVLPTVPTVVYKGLLYDTLHTLSKEYLSIVAYQVQTVLSNRTPSWKLVYQHGINPYLSLTLPARIKKQSPAILFFLLFSFIFLLVASKS